MIRYFIALALALIATPLAAQTITVAKPFADSNGDGRIDFGTANKRTYGVPYVILRGQTPNGWVYCGPKGCDAPVAAPVAAQQASVASIQAPRITTSTEPGAGNLRAPRRTNLHMLRAMEAYPLTKLEGYSNVTISDVKFGQVRALVYNRYNPDWPKDRPADAGAVRGLTMERVEAKCDKYCVSIGVPSRDTVIRDFRFTGGAPRTDSSIPVGISFGSTASNILVERGYLAGFYTAWPKDKYANGDCMSTERGNINVTIRNVTCEGASDGGFDLKSSETRLDDLSVANVGHESYRLWAQGTAGTLTSINPGWGHVQIGKTGDWVLEKLVAVGGKPLVLSEPGGKLTIKACDLTRWTGAEKVKGEGSVTLGTGC